MPEPNILERIFASKREELERTRSMVPLSEVIRQAEAAPTTVSLKDRLSRPGMQIIAEIKRASPVKGEFVSDLDHVGLAKQFARAGAAAISVITEEQYFRGSLGLLCDVRAGFPDEDRPAILRKDFLFDPYQVYEARAAGADALLLIVAMLEAGQLHDLLELTARLGMEAQVEVHDESEVETALKAGASVIGVNNRDLRSFEVDLSTTARLRRLVPRDIPVIGESGVRDRRDVEALERGGADAVHVGETLMLARDPESKIRELLGT